MSEEKRFARPRQVTTAAVMGVLGSVLLVFSLFDSVGQLRTVEMRQAVEGFLAEPPGDGLGISSGAVLDVLHGIVLFNGALAAVAAVLAVYVVQGHQGARIGFTVAAALMLFTSPLTGGALAIVVAFAAALLWGRDARDWFAGRAPATSPAGGESRRSPSAADGHQHPRESRMTVAPSEERPPAEDSRPHDAPPPGPYPPAGGEGGDTGQRPGPAARPFGQSPQQAWAPPAPTGGPGDPARGGDPHTAGQAWNPPGGWSAATPRNADRRPPTVTLAATLVWIFAGLTGALYLLVVTMLMFGQDTLLEAIHRDPQVQDLNLSTDDLLAALWVMSAVALFWCASAVALAVLAFRRHNWARYALVASSAMTALFTLLAFPVGLVHTIAAATTVFLLLTRSTNAWFARRASGSGPGGYGGSGRYDAPGQPAAWQPHQQPQQPQGPPPYGQQPPAQPPHGQPPQQPQAQPPYGQPPQPQAQPPQQPPAQPPPPPPQKPGKPPVW